MFATVRTLIKNKHGRGICLLVLSVLFIATVSFKTEKFNAAAAPGAGETNNNTIPDTAKLNINSIAYVKIRLHGSEETSAVLPVTTTADQPAQQAAVRIKTSADASTFRARQQLGAYMDTLTVSATSFGLVKNAKTIINDNAMTGVVNSNPNANKLRLLAQYPPSDPDDDTYFPMGSWNDAGVPAYLEKKPDVIPAKLLSAINNSLPEGEDVSKHHPEFLAPVANADLVITKRDDVFVTFIQSGTDYSNTIGYYTYPTNNPPVTAAAITDIRCIFPNASAGGNCSQLKPGDKVKLGTFGPGTSIGFVLLSNAYNCTSKAVNIGGLKFYSTTVCNPEADPGLKQHAVSLPISSNSFGIGFEDRDRGDAGCDNDFNDVIICVSHNPVK
jgi:hypothetical protein